MEEEIKPTHIYNMDEVGVFFELSHNHTLDLKGKKIIGKFSSGKSKERVTVMVTACWDGTLLPPVLIFKTTRAKGDKERAYPKNEYAKLDKDTESKLKAQGGMALQNYTAWCTQRVMKEFYIPYFQRKASKKHMLIMDNFSAHSCDGTIESLEKKNINYLFLAPNTTPITQPVDISIGGTLKCKIKKYFEEWLIENNEKVLTFNNTKKKYQFLSPNRNQIVEWILKAYSEIDRNLVIESRILSFYYIKL